MDNLDIVKKIKDPAIRIMKNKKILASFTISAALYYLNSVPVEDSLTLYNANNIMKRKASEKYNEDFILLSSARGVRFKKYDTIYEGIEDWLITFRSYTIEEMWDFDAIIRTLRNKEFTKANLQQYVDAYKLKDIDVTTLDQMYPRSQTIVEIPASLVSDTQFYQQMSGYTPKVSPKASISKTPPVEKPKPVIKQYIRGEKFVTKGANIFKDDRSNTASRSFTGNVWLYDGKQRNGRYAVVFNKSNINMDKTFIDGYIKKSDLH